jgi:anaerobic magnesium-protoporphyrin IX monomethyl ester cyclase
MKVLLFSPPQWIPHQPYLGLPSLTAFLKTAGVEVSQKDLNLESYDYFLSRRYLRSLKPRLEEQFFALDNRPSLSSVLESQLYADLFRAKSSARYLADSIEDAKSIFRSPRYYDAALLSKARDTIYDALALISAAHYPTRLELMSFAMPSYDGTFSSMDALTCDRRQNPYIEYFENLVLPYVRKCSPDIIGLSIAGETQLLPALTLSRALKRRFPNTHIVLGGYIVTLLSSVFLNNPQLFGHYFDSLIVLEGERPLLQLVRAIEGRESLDGVPNLIYRSGENIHENPIVPPEHMDTLPPPDYDDLPLNKYFTPEPVLPVLAARGCYWGKCAFCSHNVSYESKYRPASAEKIVGDLEFLAHRYKAKHFAFSDEAIAPSLMSRLTSLLVGRTHGFRFSTNIRIEPQFDPILCQRMYSTGFRIVYLGLESGCERVLGLMRKGFSSGDALRICRNLVEAGIWNHLYVFLGFPGEREGEANETVRFLRETKDVVKSFNLGAFTLVRGSAVMQNPEKFGVYLPPGDASGNFLIDFPYKVNEGVSQGEALNLCESAWVSLLEVYPTRNVLELIPKEDLMLYLSHFESSDPQLKTVKSPARTSVNGSPKTTPATLTRHSVPSLNTGVVNSSLSFDLPSVFINPARLEPIQKTGSHVLFHPATRRLKPLDAIAHEIVRLCDGNRNMGMIIRLLSHQSGVPEAALMTFCREILEDLMKEGFVIIN